MATPTREEQEDRFAKQLYDNARAEGLAAQAEGGSVLEVRFLDKDETGIGNEVLCATSLGWKQLHHVALYVGSRAEGRGLFRWNTRRELDTFAAQAASAAANALTRRAPSTLPAAAKRPNQTDMYDI